MLNGSVNDYINQLKQEIKWNNKKSSGNILQHDITPESSMLNQLRKQAEENRKNAEFSAICEKVMSGKDLSVDELEKLKEKNYTLYLQYQADKQEQQAYEEKLKNCKTKEEADRLHANTINGKLSQAKDIFNNPNISDAEKLSQAKRILGSVMRTVKSFHNFVENGEYEELPTEEEVLLEQKSENEAKIEELTNDSELEKNEEISEDNVSVEIDENQEIKEKPKVTAGTEYEKETINTNDILSPLEKDVLNELFEMTNSLKDEDDKKVLDIRG